MSNIDFIKSYMVRLGVDVDNASITKWDNSLKKLDDTFNSVSKSLENSDKKTHSSIKNRLNVLAKSASKVVGIFATATLGISKFMHSIADSDMEMQKFARRLYISTDQAKALQNTLGAMDLSLGDLQDVAYNPELLKQYKEFLSLAKSFKAPDGMKQSFKDIRTIFNEFQKFNLTFNYFRERVVHFIYNTVRVPAQKFREFLQTFNNKFAVNINKWAERLGTLLGIVLRLGLRMAEAFKNMGAFVLRLWNRLSGLNQKLIAGFLILNKLLRASPIWKLFTLISGLTLLYDDYKTFNEGGISSEKLKPIWKFVNEQRDNPDSTFNMILDGINKLIELLNNLTELIKALWQDLKNSRFGKWAGIQDDKPELPSGKKTNSWFLQKMEDFGLIKLKDQTPTRLLNAIENYQTPLKSGFMQTPIDQSIKSTNNTPINQTFYFNLNSNSMNNPQTFVDDVATLIRNNQSKLVSN